jgi:hypothetical protein
MAYASPDAPKASEIRAAIQRAGLTQQAAADKMKVNLPALKTWLQETAKVSDKNVEKVRAFIAKYPPATTGRPSSPPVVREQASAPYQTGAIRREDVNGVLLAVKAMAHTIGELSEGVRKALEPRSADAVPDRPTEAPSAEELQRQTALTAARAKAVETTTPAAVRRRPRASGA